MAERSSVAGLAEIQRNSALFVKKGGVSLFLTNPDMEGDLQATSWEIKKLASAAEKLTLFLRV